MSAMARTLGGFRAALWIGWIALGVAGLGYARLKGIPNWAALPILAAFLVEYPFYLVAGFASVRERLSGPALPAFLVVSATLPYLAATPAIEFHFAALAQLAALALALGLWYRVLPVSALTDIGFLALIASVYIFKYFDGIYPVLFKIRLSFLGHLTAIHLGVLVLILERRIHETGYGFWPNLRDWRMGVLNYLYFLPIGVALALGLHAVRPGSGAPIWLVPGIFLGMLWTVALSEEFLFRGVLQQWLEEWAWSRSAALVLTSLAFGVAHLWFRGFPNWRWALIAVALGWFCGRARNQAGNIRAGMVTHALVIATWMGFFA
jgi:membrane protease YdiL (CAAX protease family)